jgi:hypothetical protein
MKSYQWQLVHTFTLPLDSKGNQLWRVDYDANYHNDLAKLRNEYQEYQHETRGDIHTQIEFWVLLPTDNPTVLYETTDYKMDELAGDYAGTPNRFIIYCKKTKSGIYDKHSYFVKMNYNDCKTMIDHLQAVENSTPENNQIKPIDFKQLQDKQRFKGELDTLFGTIEELLRDDNLENYPELNCALQDVHSLIEKLDIKIDYYNC